MATESPFWLRRTESAEMASESEREIACLKNFESLCSSSLGIAGRPKLVYNGAGGDNVASSVSSRIFPILRPSSNVVKFMMSALTRHVKLHGDGGWSTAVLSSRLILGALNSGVPRRLASMIFDEASVQCFEWLKGGEFASRVVLSLDSLEHIAGLVAGIVDPKSSNLGMSGEEVKNFKSRIVEYFLKYHAKHCSEGSAKDVQHIINAGTLPPKVRLLEGVIVETNDYSPGDYEKVKNRTNLVVALYECSLNNHDCKGLYVSVEADDERTLEEASLMLIADRMESLLDSVKIDMLLCQKVIHPQIKCLLKERSILIMERLGREKMEAIHSEIGGTVASSHSQPLTISDVGLVEETHVEERHNGRPLVRIVGKRRNGCLVVDALSRELANDALHIFKMCLASLRSTMESGGILLLGRGGWQREMAEKLKHKIPSLRAAWSSQLECNPGQVELILDATCTGFLRLCETTNSHENDAFIGHPVFDVCAQAASSIQTAFFTASTVLATADFL